MRVKMSVEVGVVAGEVYDDTRSLPLEGVLAEAFAADTGELLGNVQTDNRGRYLLDTGQPSVRIRLSKLGFTMAERTATSQQGGLADVLDARLTPLAQPQGVTALLGAEVKDAAGDVLSVPPGALGSDFEVRLTPISSQGPMSPFPPGWAPLATVQLEVPGVLDPAATLDVVEWSGAAAGKDAVFVRYDRNLASWVTVAGVVVPADGLVRLEAVTGSGQYALLLADSGEGAPGAAILGEPLAAGSTIPIPESVQASGTVAPAVGRADDPRPAAASVGIVSQTPLRSGTVLRGDFMELFLLRDGGRLAPLPTSQDLFAYRSPADTEGRTLTTNFPIAASRTFGVAELSEGAITVSLLRGAAVSRTLIGTAGGGVQIGDGSRVVVPAGAFTRDVPVTLRRLDAASFSTTTPAGVTFVGGLELDLAGATATSSLALTLSGAAGLVPTGSQVIVAEVRNVLGRDRLVFVTLARIDGDSLTTLTEVGGVALPGVRAGGRYGFYRYDGPLDLITGTARDEVGQRDGHLIELNTSAFVSLTDASGFFALVSPPGAFKLLATGAAIHDQVSLDGNTATPLPEIIITATPPRVELITVRLPRVEGNIAGPVVLLGKPAPIIDDDNTGASSGDGNGQIEQGERIELTLTVRNDGTAALKSGFFALSISAQGNPISVQPDRIPVGELPPDLPVSVGPFLFEAPSGVDPTRLRYTLSYATDAGLSRAIPFGLPLGVDHLNVPVRSEITVHFSEPVVPASLNGAIALEKEAGSALESVPIKLFVGNDGTVATVRPLAPLDDDAFYRVALASGIVDLDGRALADTPVVERFNTEDLTPPAPIDPGRIEASVPDDEGFVRVTGSLGSVNPDDVVIVLNETTGFTDLATVNADGSFVGRVRADVTDRITIIVRDRNDNEFTVGTGPLVRRDPATGEVVSVVIGREGGSFTSGDGISLTVPAGALFGATEISASRVSEEFTLPPDLASDASTLAAFESLFNVVDRVRIGAGAHRFAAPIRLSLPAPAGAAEGDLFLVVRNRAVTIGGPLADIDQVSGLPTAQNPQKTVERFEVIETATVKDQGGQLVLSTDSPPFPGITKPGTFTILEALGPVTFLAGEVRRDTTTGPLVPGAVVQSLPSATATAPFATVTDTEGKFVVPDASLPGPFQDGAVVTSRLDVTDPDFRRVIRRDVHGVVGPAAPPNTVVANLAEPFVLPAKLPPAFIDILGDIEPPAVEISITGPSFANGFSRVGDQVTVTVVATDNDVVDFVGLETNQGGGFEAVSLAPDRTFSITPLVDAVITFRAQAHDRSGNVTFVDARIRTVTAEPGAPLMPGPLPPGVGPGGEPTPNPPQLLSADNVSFDGDFMFRFSEPLDPATVTDRAFRVLDPEGRPVGINVSLEGGGALVRVAPKRYLRLGATYTIEITQSVRDADSEGFAGTTLKTTIPQPEEVTRIDVLNAEDVALSCDTLVATGYPNSANRDDMGAIHTFGVRGPDGFPLEKPVRLTPVEGVKTNGHPLSVAVDGGFAFVGNRFLGPIATKEPLFTPDLFVDFNSAASPFFFPTQLSETVSFIWKDFPSPPSNLEVFELSDHPATPRRLGGWPINFKSLTMWNPNTWPTRVEVTNHGIAVHNLTQNLEFFTPSATPRSNGMLGLVEPWGTSSGRCRDKLGPPCLSTLELPNGNCRALSCIPTTEFLDATTFDERAAILERDGVRIVSTADVGDSLAVAQTLRFFQLSGTSGFGGRVGAVPGFEWVDSAQGPRTSDLVFVATREDRRLRIFDIRDPASSPLSTLEGVIGNMSFDRCRGLAYLVGPNGEFHIVDFNDPTRPSELNDPGGSNEPFVMEGLGSSFLLKENVNREYRVYAAADAGVGVVETRRCGPVVEAPGTDLAFTSSGSAGCASRVSRCLRESVCEQCPGVAKLRLAVGKSGGSGHSFVELSDANAPDRPSASLTLELDASVADRVEAKLTQFAYGAGEVSFSEDSLMLMPGVPAEVEVFGEQVSSLSDDTLIQVRVKGAAGPVCAQVKVTVVGLDLRLDSNNDLKITNQDDRDEKKPPGFTFWVPEDRSDEDDKRISPGQDPRDLENFATAVLRINSASGLPEGYRYFLELKQPEGASGNPAIRVFPKMGTDLQYLTNKEAAEKQLTAELKGKVKIDAPMDVSSDPSSQSTMLEFLIQGISEGDGLLRLVLKDPENNEVLSDEAYLTLKPLRSMYTVADVRDPPSLEWPLRGRGFGEGNELQKRMVTVFVHGYNVPDGDAGAYPAFDTVFRRFYWTGLTNPAPAGSSDFIGLTWTGNEGLLPGPLKPAQYNKNVFNAFQASVPVAGLFQVLRQGREVNVFAHSLGNVVVSNAIKIAAAIVGPDEKILDTYLLHQAAVASNAYNEALPRHPFLVAKALPWGYPTDLQWLGQLRWTQYDNADPWGGYFGGVPTRVGKMVNTWSEADCVLGLFNGGFGAWWVNQALSRPDCTIRLPDGPGLCPRLFPPFLFSWFQLPEGPNFNMPGLEREWAELAYYFTDLAAPAGVVQVEAPGVVNSHVRNLGIDGPCVESVDEFGRFFNGVHSAFAEKPLYEVWPFWEVAARALGAGSE